MSRHSKWLGARPFSVLLGVTALACGVDDRTLNLSTAAGATGAGARSGAGVGDGKPEGGDGSSPQAQGGTSGAGSEASAGGDWATPPELPPLLDGCADLDTDGVPDCSVTLVKNATFESDVSGWKSVDASAISWSSDNALEDTPSGCALLTAQGATDAVGNALIRAAQCVPVAGEQLVIVFANAFVEAGAEAATTSQAKLDVSYFDAEDCAGTATGSFATPPNAVAGAWVTVQAGGVTGAATKSALVELVGIKPYRADALRACFDNIMLKIKPL